MTHLSDLDTSKKIQASVVETSRITPDNVAEVRNIRLVISNTNFIYRVGQNIGVIVPGAHDYGYHEHFRLYTIANAYIESDSDNVEIELCVRRCFYIDEVSGEEYPGISSNYLCDLSTGDQVTLTGPYGDAFTLPENIECNLLMIGTGTGIAPFRAFIQHIYEKQPGWQGQIRLFYGARTGMETLYRNDAHNDLGQYYDRKTFMAFEGLVKRPWMQQEETGLHDVLQDNANEVWNLMQDPKTYLYIAGLPNTLEEFYKSMAKVAGSETRMRWMREEMLEQRRWSELIYQ